MPMALIPWRPWGLIPAHHIQLVQELIDPGVIIVTLCSYKVQGSAVLSTDLLHQVIRDFLGLAGGWGAKENHMLIPPNVKEE